MTLVPMLDLRPAAPAPAPAESFSLAAEQALLGVVLYDNDALWTLEQAPGPDDFFEPFHGRLWDEICASIRQGYLAEPVIVADRFRKDPAFIELGATSYLGDLIARAPPTTGASHYARIVIEHAVRRRMAALGQQIATQAADGTEPTDTLIEQVETALLEMRKTDPHLTLVTAAQAGARVIAHVENREAPAGVMTGLEPLDRQLGPLQDGHMIVIGGRPSMGKSALAGHLGLRMASPEFWVEARNGRDAATGLKLPPPAGFIEISLEMSVEEMTWRHLSDMGFHLYGTEFPTYEEIASKAVSVEQFEMLRQVEILFEALPIAMLSRPALQLGTVFSLARRQKVYWERQGIRVGAVALDNLGLVRAEGRTSGRYEAQTEVSQGAKGLAQELACPLIVLVQLHRQVESREDKHPQLSDLRDSGSIEQDADVVLFPYREAYYAEKEPEPKGGEAIYAAWNDRKASKSFTINIAKRRGGRSGGTANCWADMAWNAIRPVAPARTFFGARHEGQTA